MQNETFFAMKKLFSKMRLLLKTPFRKIVAKDSSNFECSILSGEINYTWKIRRDTKDLINKQYNSALFLRMRDISGDGTSASLSVETTTRQNNTKINLPTDGGKVLVELGYKTDGGEFITLEYKIYDFGVKKDKTRKYSDWFEVESEGIHQEMYEIASRSRLIGGSEEHLV